jgi:NitT/TauT family transport system substrate-binding protein
MGSHLARIVVLVAAFGAWSVVSAFSPAAKKISVALQEGGTASWEAAAMQDLRIDIEKGIKLEIRPVADSKAGQVALQAGEVDTILSDFIWTSIQRHQGADFAIVPHSLTVGALMVMPDGPVKSVEDLKGATLAVAGGPVDKSYLVLQAYYNMKTGAALPEDINAVFGAPPLVNEVLGKGEAQAALNFWHFNTRAKVAGATELVTVHQMLAELGVERTPPMLGWVFSEKNARRKKQEFQRFLDASFATKAALLTDDAVWERIRPVMNVGDDDALFIALRDAYRAGIVTSYGDEDIAAAVKAYELMAKFGGSELIGDNPALAEGTFWAGYRK